MGLCKRYGMYMYAHLFGHSYHFKFEWAITMQVAVLANVHVQFHRKEKFSMISKMFSVHMTKHTTGRDMTEDVNLSYHNKEFYLSFYSFYHLITNILMQYRGCLLLSIRSSSHYEFTLFLHHSRNDTNAISFLCSMLSSKIFLWYIYLLPCNKRSNHPSQIGK